MILRLVSLFSFFIMSQHNYAKTICYKNITVFLEGRFVKQDFCFNEETGHICEPQENNEISWRNGHDKTIIPGFIDLQVNGAFGECFTQDPSSIERVAQKIARTGVTSFSPTVISSHPELYEKVSEHYKAGKVNGGVHILGLHCEGPFINKLGVHNPEAAQKHTSPEKEESIAFFKRTYQNLLDNHIRMVTLAPDLPGMLDVIEHLSQKGIIVSLGHSHASSETGHKAIAKGARMFTHLFNAMKSTHHREPSLPVAALTTDEEQVYYGMIADFIHVHPDTIKMAFKSNPRMILVTDAMAGLGKKVGESVQIGSEKILIKQQLFDGKKLKKAIKKEGEEEVLAGSVVSMIESVNNLKNALGSKVPWEEVLKTATTNPAHLLGISKEKNLKSPFSEADFLVLKGDLKEKSPKTLELEETYCKGELLYQKRIQIFKPNAKSLVSSKEELGFEVAGEMLETILENNKKNKKTVFGLATGSTPLPTYKAFITLVKAHAKNSGDYSFLKNLITYNLDEYIGPSNSKDEKVYKQSYRYFMDTHLFDELVPYGLQKNQTFLPEPGDSPEEAVLLYEKRLAENKKQHGGLDLQILGIGRNGHIGFAEPGSAFTGRTKIFTLKKETREDNKRFFEREEDVPQKAISMGIGTILEAKKIFLLATGKSKAYAIKQSLQEDMTEDVPASALQDHHHVSFFLDEESASLL